MIIVYIDKNTVLCSAMLCPAARSELAHLARHGPHWPLFTLQKYTCAVPSHVGPLSLVSVNAVFVELGLPADEKISSDCTLVAGNDQSCLSNCDKLGY